MKNEIWALLPSAPQTHAISNKGRVRVLSSGKILPGCALSNGKVRVAVKINNKYRQPYVHREVFAAFSRGTPDYGDKTLVVRHKDGDLLNNSFDNLELITKSESLKGYSK